jgi:glycosyltransferase involved in cell wall biosynthesis
MISVIIPIYNSAKYLERCVVSLFIQTLADIEYIFVDDCSNDNSIGILYKTICCYPSRQNQVKIIQLHKNVGAAKARSIGLKIATGEYITYCDSDDWLSENMYEIGVPAFRIISICFLPASFGIITSALFQATGHGVMSLWMSLIRQLVVILPLAFIFSRLWGLPAVWAAFPLAEVIGLSFAIICLVKVYRKEISKLDR